MPRKKKKTPALLLAVLIIAWLAFPTAARPVPRDYLQLRAACGVRSTFSTGSLGLEEIARLAAEHGIDVVVMGDRHRSGFEYGFPRPLPLIRFRWEDPSVYTLGAERYLSEIRRINSLQERVLFIPGVELLTRYSWSGSPLGRDLTLQADRLNLHVIGLQRPADYRRLPVIDGPFSTRYAVRLLPYALIYAALLSTGFFMLRSRRRVLLAGSGLLVAGLAGLLGHHPFRSTPYDAYGAEAGLAPYQEVIDYAAERGAIVSWSALEAGRPLREVGGVPVRAHPPRPSVLLDTRGYTAFAALYGGQREAHLPGGIWDQVLLEYCRGERLRPIWGMGSIDFQQPGSGPWMRLDGIQTVLLVRNRSEKEILEALRRGRMYSVFQGGPAPIRLDYFQVRSTDGRVAEQGEELPAAGRLEIAFRIRLEDGSRERLKVQLIRSGRLLQELWVETPVERRFLDSMPPNGGKYYYRLIVKSPRHEILTNPIFATF